MERVAGLSIKHDGYPEIGEISSMQINGPTTYKVHLWSEEALSTSSARNESNALRINTNMVQRNRNDIGRDPTNKRVHRRLLEKSQPNRQETTDAQSHRFIDRSGVERECSVENVCCDFHVQLTIDYYKKMERTHTKIKEAKTSPNHTKQFSYQHPNAIRTIASHKVRNGNLLESRVDPHLKNDRNMSVENKLLLKELPHRNPLFPNDLNEHHLSRQDNKKTQNVMNDSINYQRANETQQQDKIHRAWHQWGQKSRQVRINEERRKQLLDQQDLHDYHHHLQQQYLQYQQQQQQMRQQHEQQSKQVQQEFQLHHQHSSPPLQEGHHYHYNSADKNDYQNISNRSPKSLKRMSQIYAPIDFNLPPYVSKSTPARSSTIARSGSFTSTHLKSAVTNGSNSNENSGLMQTDGSTKSVNESNSSSTKLASTNVSSQIKATNELVVSSDLYRDRTCHRAETNGTGEICRRINNNYRDDEVANTWVEDKAERNGEGTKKFSPSEIRTEYGADIANKLSQDMNGHIAQESRAIIQRYNEKIAEEQSNLIAFSSRHGQCNPSLSMDKDTKKQLITIVPAKKRKLSCVETIIDNKSGINVSPSQKSPPLDIMTTDTNIDVLVPNLRNEAPVESNNGEQRRKLQCIDSKIITRSSAEVQQKLKSNSDSDLLSASPSFSFAPPTPPESPSPDTRGVVMVSGVEKVTIDINQGVSDNKPFRDINSYNKINTHDSEKSTSFGSEKGTFDAFQPLFPTVGVDNSSHVSDHISANTSAVAPTDSEIHEIREMSLLSDSNADKNASIRMVSLSINPSKHLDSIPTRQNRSKTKTDKYYYCNLLCVDKRNLPGFLNPRVFVSDIWGDLKSEDRHHTAKRNERECTFSETFAVNPCSPYNRPRIRTHASKHHKVVNQFIKKSKKKV